MKTVEDEKVIIIEQVGALQIITTHKRYYQNLRCKAKAEDGNRRNATSHWDCHNNHPPLSLSEQEQ